MAPRDELKTSDQALPYARVGNEYAKGACAFQAAGLATAGGDILFLTASLLTNSETPEKAAVQVVLGLAAVGMIALSRSNERKKELFHEIANQMDDYQRKNK